MELLAILITSLIAPAILLIMNRKVKDVHRQVTVNHHSSENPTILDELSDIKSMLLHHFADKDAHR